MQMINHYYISLFIAFTILAGIYITGAEEAGIFRVATFNLRRAGDKTPNSWPERLERVRGVIHDHKFEVIGMQEATYEQIENLLTDGWAYTGVGRDDGKRRGEFACIFYRKERFEVRDSGTFWLSETPEAPGSKSWDTACTRICTWARMADRKTGRIFYMFNTHLDHKSALAQKNGMALILQRIKAVEKGIPVILTGDWNATPESEPVKLALAVMLDSEKVTRTPHSGPTGTCGGFKFDKTPTKRIDYIFVSQEIRVLSHSTLDDSQNGLYPSDHFPVMAQLELE